MLASTTNTYTVVGAVIGVVGMLLVFGLSIMGFFLKRLVNQLDTLTTNLSALTALVIRLDMRVSQVEAQEVSVKGADEVVFHKPKKDES